MSVQGVLRGVKGVFRGVKGVFRGVIAPFGRRWLLSNVYCLMFIVEC